MAMAEDVVLEETMQLDFIEEVHSIPGGEKIKDCIQCGSCSGSCPTSYLMDHAPRRIFARLRAGMRDAVLSSNTLWLCTSCYTCYVRCPQEIKITDIMYALKRIAIRDGKYPKGVYAQEMSKTFVDMVNKYGRNHEMELMTRYLLKTNPFELFRNATVGLSLLRHKRMPLFPHKIKGIEQLRKLIRKVESMGGA
jgi:heterodisulfide reductase subunit C